MISLVDAQGDDNTQVTKRDHSVVSIIILVVNCTTPAWPIVRKVWTGKHKEYFKMISTLFKIPLKVIRTCYLCCTGVDLDEQEREAEHKKHMGFKSWSHFGLPSFSRAASTFSRTSSDPKTKHPEWRQGQERSWQKADVDLGLQDDEARGVFNSPDAAVESAAAQQRSIETRKVPIMQSAALQALGGACDSDDGSGEEEGHVESDAMSIASRSSKSSESAVASDSIGGSTGDGATACLKFSRRGSCESAVPKTSAS